MLQGLFANFLKVLLVILGSQLLLTHSQRNSGQFPRRPDRDFVNIGEYPEDNGIRRQIRPDENGDIYEFHRFQHYGFKTPSPNTFSLESMLAFLAPLATIPIIASAALSSLAAILPTLTTEGMVKGRSRRDAVLETLGSMKSFNNPDWKLYTNQTTHPIKRDIRDLDVIQKYLQQMSHKEDHNDEIMASYLKCSGMLSTHNHCLERLVCQFSDDSARMKSLEKEVSSLIIYTILNNRFIPEEFKERLRKAALFGRGNNGRCGTFYCSKNDFRV